MKYRYYAAGSIKPGLLEWLEKNEIKYSIPHEFVIINIVGPNERERAVLEELSKKNQLILTVTCVFDKKDLERAKLLTIRPKFQKFDYSVEDPALVEVCEGVQGNRHLLYEQVGNLKVWDLPSTNSKTHFWAEAYVARKFLFTTRTVYDLVQANDIKGAVFKNVIVRGGKYSEDFYQLTSDTVIGRECVKLGYGEKEFSCQVCGQKWYSLGNTVQLHLDFSKFELYKDIYITESMFGYNSAAPLYIVSQKLYRLLNENKLLKNVIVEPVFDESK